MRVAHRLAAVCGAVPLVLGGLVAAAPVAHADRFTCFAYVAENVDQFDVFLVDYGCALGAEGDVPSCRVILGEGGVPAAVATEACIRSAQD